MLFVDGNNIIQLLPNSNNKLKQTTAIIRFGDGENPLSGVPRNLVKYSIEYKSLAIPTEENIISILQWRNMESLTIADDHSVTVDLLKHLDELSKMPKLAVLVLPIQSISYDQLNVAQIIAKLTHLKGLRFHAVDMTFKQRKAFYDKNEAPTNWTRKIVSNRIDYHILN